MQRDDKTVHPSQPAFDPVAYKTTLRALGATQEDVARVTGIGQANISAMLRGRQYSGAARHNRLQDALHQIALEIAEKRRQQAADAEKLAAELAEAKAKAEDVKKAQAKPNIRRL